MSAAMTARRLRLVLDDPDEMAVYRAKHGDRVALTAADRLAVVVELTRAGESARAIGRRLRISSRTVQRERRIAVAVGQLEQPAPVYRRYAGRSAAVAA